MSEGSTNKRQSLLKKLHGLAPWPQRSYQGPVVTLEEFFEGNDDLGSICCNLVDGPSLRQIFERLKGVRQRSDVQVVLVQVYETMEEVEGAWPYSESVLIYTSAPLANVERWAESLHADKVHEGPLGETLPPLAPEPEPGMRVYTLWWD